MVLLVLEATASCTHESGLLKPHGEFILRVQLSTVLFVEKANVISKWCLAGEKILTRTSRIAGIEKEPLIVWPRAFCTGQEAGKDWRKISCCEPQLRSAVPVTSAPLTMSPEYKPRQCAAYKVNGLHRPLMHMQLNTKSRWR